MLSGTEADDPKKKEKLSEEEIYKRKVKSIKLAIKVCKEIGRLIEHTQKIEISKGISFDFVFLKRKSTLDAFGKTIDTLPIGKFYAAAIADDKNT